MKKIISVLVIALFLFSIIPVFAHEEDTNERSGSNEEERIESHSEVREEMMVNHRGERNQTEGLSAFGRVAGEISSNTNLGAKERHEMLRQKFQEVKEQFNSDREAFLSAKTNLKVKVAEVKAACKEDRNGRECLEKRSDVMKKDAKNYMLKALDTMEKVLEKRKAKIEELMARADASAEVKAKLQIRLDNIDARLETIAQLRADVDNDSTSQDVKASARRIRSEWRDIKADLEVSAGDILSHRFSFAVKRAESLERKLERSLDRLEAKGVDISVVQSEIISFHAHIDKAQDFAVQARAKFNAESRTDADVKAGHALLVQAQGELKLAHESLKSIVRSLKASVEGEAELNVVSESEENGEQETDVDDHEDSEDSDDHDAEASVSASSETEVETEDSDVNVGADAGVDVNVAV